MRCLHYIIFVIIVHITSSGVQMPIFSWDHVPLFIHMCNASGAFNESTIQYLSKFPIITIEKGQGVNSTIEPYASLYTEDKILKTCERIKQYNSSIKCIFYYNSILDWTYYKLHQILIENPSYWLRDENNNIVLQHGDYKFPQPSQGMLIFDYQQKMVQDLMIKQCLNLTQTGYIDGCFIDKSGDNTQQLQGYGSIYNFTKGQSDNFEDGHNMALLSIQKELNKTNKSIMISNDLLMNGIIAIMIDFFEANQESIQLLQSYAKQGILVEVHAGIRHQNGNDHYCENITNSLSAFLIGAGKYSYYGCSRGWYIEDDWMVWHEQYDKPLGEPMGIAVLQKDVYKRTFASGTIVTFNITINVGNIIWA